MQPDRKVVLALMVDVAESFQKELTRVQLKLKDLYVKASEVQPDEVPSEKHEDLVMQSIDAHLELSAWLFHAIEANREALQMIASPGRAASLSLIARIAGQIEKSQARYRKEVPQLSFHNFGELIKKYQLESFFAHDDEEAARETRS
jgi:hypothetical protein